MAIASSTLAATLNDTDNVLVVASSTGYAAGNVVRLEDEVLTVQSSYVLGVDGVRIPVARGQFGTANVAHSVGQYICTGLGSEFSNPGAGQLTPYPVFGRSRPTRSYAADGAIDLPLAGGELIALLTKTSALAMTLADPTKDMDGACLIILSGTKVAHTIDVAGGVGGNGASSNLITFDSATAQGVMLFAINTRWVSTGLVITAATVAAPSVT